MKVDVEGLTALASHCDQLAGDLALAVEPQQCGASWQATSSAIDTVNASVSSAASRLTNRMSATAAKLLQTSMIYTAQDEDSAGKIRATVV